jgi:hypothetical protein
MAEGSEEGGFDLGAAFQAAPEWPLPSGRRGGPPCLDKRADGERKGGRGAGRGPAEAPGMRFAVRRCCGLCPACAKAAVVPFACDRGIPSVARVAKSGVTATTESNAFSEK